MCYVYQSVMHRRKIQLIAGTTYSVSLPKEWVKKNNLKEQNEILFYEKGDRTLLLSPDAAGAKDLKAITLNIDNYLENIDQVLFAVYYVGVEIITLFSTNKYLKCTKFIELIYFPFIFSNFSYIW